jgi:Na+/proline symporter
MNFTIYSALAVTAIAFILISVFFRAGVKRLSDFVPVERNGQARVRSRQTFSTSTIATSISLATIVAAYFGLAKHFGLWLLWTAITAGLGMFVVYKLSPRISAKLKVYPNVPSIHEFLAAEYSVPQIKPVAAIFTAIGLLLLLATELLVGGAFLTQLIPGADRWILTLTLAAVPLLYVIMGGFGAVIVTDRIQMGLIWGMICALFIVLLFSGDYSPENLRQAAPLRAIDSGLLWFLIGIALMNIPTALSSITVWQRIAACESDKVLKAGLRRSAVGIFIAWSLLVVIAWAAGTSGSATTPAELCGQLLDGATRTPFGLALVFLIVVGLYSAQLSTASTFLIASGHTITTDILNIKHAAASEDSNTASVRVSQIAIVISSLVSCSVVVLFEKTGYNIEDIIFSIYGGALALFPPILVALLLPRDSLKHLSKYAFIAVTMGFLSGWSAALAGKISGAQNLIFMSPAVGMIVSGLVLLFGWNATKHARRGEVRSSGTNQAT